MSHARASATPDEPRPAPAATAGLARYQPCGEIARGGMGSVHLARLRVGSAFDKWVAIKVIHPEFARDQRFVRMFAHEARILARLSHPNLCAVFDFGDDGGACFLAMEYLRGEPLRELARRGWTRGGLAPGLVARIGCDAARGLHAAHEARLADGTPAGVVHRDVAPGNIFVTYDGPAKVLDFGIARSIEAEVTRPGEVRGNLPYMSPEQLAGRAVDRRSDVFSLGVVLWEITAGQRLFRRDTPEATIAAVMSAPLPSLATVRPACPAAMVAVLERAIARDPDARFATASDLARALEGVLSMDGLQCSTDDVGETMRSLFADRIAEGDALLRSLASLPARYAVDPFQPAATLPPAVERVPVAAPSRRRWVAGALTVLALAAGTVFVAARVRARTDDTVPALPASARTAPTAAPSFASAAPVAPLPALATSPAAAPVALPAVHRVVAPHHASHARRAEVQAAPMRDFGGLR